MSLLKEINNSQLDEGLHDTLAKIAHSAGSLVGKAKSSSLGQIYRDAKNKAAGEESSDPASPTTETEPEDLSADLAQHGNTVKIIKDLLHTGPAIVALCTFDEAKALVTGKSAELLTSAQLSESASLLQMIINERVEKNAHGNLKVVSDKLKANIPQRTQDAKINNAQPTGEQTRKADAAQAAMDQREKTMQDEVSAKVETDKAEAEASKSSIMLKLKNPDIAFMYFANGIDFNKVKAALNANKFAKKAVVFHPDSLPQENTKDAILSKISKDNYVAVLQSLGLRRMLDKLPNGFTAQAFHDDDGEEAILKAFDVTIRSDDKECVVAHYKDHTVFVAAAKEWMNSSFAADKKHAQEIKNTEIATKNASDLAAAEKVSSTSSEDILKVFTKLLDAGKGKINIARALKSGSGSELARFSRQDVKAALGNAKNGFSAEIQNQINDL